jgi:hypothetical protein
MEVSVSPRTKIKVTPEDVLDYLLGLTVKPHVITHDTLNEHYGAGAWENAMSQLVSRELVYVCTDTSYCWD